MESIQACPHFCGSFSCSVISLALAQEADVFIVNPSHKALIGLVDSPARETAISEHKIRFYLYC